MPRNEFDWMREIQDFANRLKHSVENFERPGQYQQTSRQEHGVTPAADLLFVDGAFLAELEIPGMNKEDIMITMVGNAVEVSGEKKPIRDANARLLQGGRRYGAFRRRIELPNGADVDMTKVSAAYENGVLRITLPQREKDPGVSIPIN